MNFVFTETNNIHRYSMKSLPIIHSQFQSLQMISEKTDNSTVVCSQGLVENGTVVKCVDVKVFFEKSKNIDKVILVVEYLDTAWLPILPNLSGIITEIGGTLSHVSIVAREHGIPMMSGVKIDELNDLEKIDLDCYTNSIVKYKQ